MGGRQPSNPTVHSGTLPQRTGRHILLAVWDIADTGNAFYQCSDVDFG
jgi:chitin-binding protein